MAITWGGSVQVDGTARTRVGIEVATSSNSSSATATVTYWLGQRYHENRSMTLHYGGAISGTNTFQNNYGKNGDSSYHAVKIATHTYTYTYGGSEYGSSPGRRTFNAYIATGVNSTPTVSTTWVIPARPYDKPADPTNLGMHWQGDGSGSTDTIVCTWTRHSTDQAPWRTVHVNMAYFDGSTFSGYGSQGGVNLTGSASSYAVQVGTANRAARFRVSAANPSGSSDNVYVSPLLLFGPPAAPTSVRAKVTGGGGSIALTWVPNCYTVGATTHEVYRSVNGGAYASVKTGLSATATGWTDAAPGAGSNTYQVRAKHTKEALDDTDLFSAWATSNTVSTIVAPLAPSNLSPDGNAYDLTQDVPLSWQHNDGGDGADPTAFVVQYSSDGGSTWTDLTSQTSSDTEWTLPGGTLANGATYQWRVYDQGVASAGFGPASTPATITGSAAPTVTITSPAGTMTTGRIDAVWTYAQADGSAQARWVANLLDADGNLLEAHQGFGASTSHPFSTYCADGATYKVTVLVTSAAGVAGSASSTFTVDVPAPAPLTVTWPGLDAPYDAGSGSVVLHIESQAPGTGQAETVSATVERSVDGGSTFVRLFDQVSLPMDIVDPLPLTLGQTVYRLTSISAEPGYYANPDLVIDAPSGDIIGDVFPMTLPFRLSSTPTPESVWRVKNRYVFLSYGDDFSNTVKLSRNPQISVTPSRSRALSALAGARFGRQMLGQNRSFEIAVSADLFHGPKFTDPDSAPPAWEAAALEAGVVCVRDPMGHRVFGVLSDVQVQSAQAGLGSVSFTVSEDDFTETWG